MEAPKKIYIQPSTIEQLPHQNIVYTKPLADNSIEYVRKDAFIEKTERYIRSVAVGLDRDDDVEAFISEFIKYMKGE